MQVQFAIATPTQCCRLCLDLYARPPFYSLFADRAAEMLESLTSIKLNPDDATPNMTCVTCLADLKLAYKIQQKIVKTEKVLQKKLSKIKIKKENDTSTNEANLNTNKQGTNVSAGDLKKLDNNFVKIKQEEDVSAEEVNLNSKEQGENVSEEERNKSTMTFENEVVTVDIPHTKLTKVITPNLFTRLTPCTMCPKMLPAREINQHKLTHTGFCEYCGTTFKNRNTLRTHVLVNHKQLNIKCTRCDAVLANKKEYRVHLQKNHRSDICHVCDECGVSYVAITDLKMHKLSKHSNERPFSCDVCNKGFVEKYKLYSHKLSHSDKMLFICEFCGRGFKFKANMNVHKKNIHGWKCEEKFKCVTCEKGFATELSLNIHTTLTHRK